jgi:hypothetical protein
MTVTWVRRLGVRSAPLHDLYPEPITEALRAALLRFNSALPGFLGPEGVLHGVETRTSAPVRPAFLRLQPPSSVVSAGSVYGLLCAGALV